MSEIHVSCIDQVLKITNAPVLASGGLNEVTVIFDFCEKWDGFIKTAVFYRDEENRYYAVLDGNDTCTVPWEVCGEEGAFFFSVFGENGLTRRTAITVRYKVVKGAITADFQPSDPTPELYDQILGIVNEAKREQAVFTEEASEEIQQAVDIATNASATADAALAQSGEATTYAEDANSTAEEARIIAQQANSTAEEASSAAEEAIIAADTAKSAALSAAENADQAADSAIVAKNYAEEAKSDAKQAKSNSATAASLADTANATANRAEGNAKTALAKAESALAQSTDAVETAENALEIASDPGRYVIDKICPSFTESGSAVACEPLSGYPLTVQTDGATKVYRSGKNIIPPWTGSRTTTGMTFKGNGDGSISVTGTPTKQWTASCFIDIPPEIMKGGKTYSCTPASNSSYEIFFRYKDADGNFKNTERAGVMNRITWDDSWYEPQVQIHFPDIQAYNETVWLQLELGETATDYEPYRTPDEFALGEAIPTLGGVNTIWADSGDVTVTGKADPAAVIGQLAASIPSDDHINTLIDAKLGVIENGTY